jgi:hypothetical protein
VKRAKCIIPVQVYDEGLTGYYEPGQVIEGEAAERLLHRHPAYFSDEGEENA